MMQQFLSALREVFSDCLKITGYEAAFALQMRNKSAEQLEAIGLDAMAEYHRVMSPWYARCSQRDETLLQERIEFLDKLDLAAKWHAGIHADTKSAIWEYINQLNNFCCLMTWTQDMMPPSIMAAITSNASQLASKLKTGEMTMQDFNVMELSQSILASVDAGELEQLGARIQSSDGLDIGNMCTMLSSMMPANNGEAGGFNLSALLGSLAPPPHGPTK